MPAQAVDEAAPGRGRAHQGAFEGQGLSRCRPGARPWPMASACSLHLEASRSHVAATGTPKRANECADRVLPARSAAAAGRGPRRRRRSSGARAAPRRGAGAPGAWHTEGRPQPRLSRAAHDADVGVHGARQRRGVALRPPARAVAAPRSAPPATGSPPLRRSLGPPGSASVMRRPPSSWWRLPTRGTPRPPATPATTWSESALTYGRSPTAAPLADREGSFAQRDLAGGPT